MVYEPTISLLDTIVASNEFARTPAFHALFDQCINALHDADYYLETQKPQKEYWEFFAALQTEVTKS